MIAGLVLACSGPGVIDDDDITPPSPSEENDTVLHTDTTPPDTIRPDTAITRPDTVATPADTTSAKHDTVPTPPDTTKKDTLQTRTDTLDSRSFSVREARRFFQDHAGLTVRVSGYIVGTVKGRTLNGKNLTGPFGVETNILLSDTPNPKSDSDLMPIELRSGSKARHDLNLVKNASLYHYRVSVSGTLTTYYGTAGIKNVSDYTILGK